MTRLVFFHLAHDGLRAQIDRWQPVQVPFEVLLNLPFGFDDEAEADRVTDAPGEQSDAECAGVSYPTFYEDLARVAER